jgi:uncharacterized protein
MCQAGQSQIASTDLVPMRSRTRSCHRVVESCSWVKRCTGSSIGNTEWNTLYNAEGNTLYNAEGPGLDVSPFPYQGPLSPEQVHGRDDLLADLTDRVTERRVTALLGPRRYGKTSVLRRLAHDLREVTTIAVDLYGAVTHADLAIAFSDALAAESVRPLAEKLAVAVNINLGVVRLEVAKPPRQRPDPAVLYRNLIDVVVRLARSRPTLLVIDEFQSISRVDGAAEALRTVLQDHYRDMGLVFAGSEPSLMRNMFTSPETPFFAQADIVMIQPLGLDATLEIVEAGFARTGRDAGPTGGLIHDVMRGHPWRTMMAADAAWRHTPPGGRASDATWGGALNALRASEAATIAARFAALPVDEQKVLRVVASGGALYGTAGQRMELSAGGATHARGRLLDAGRLTKDDDGQLWVTDPLMADWIRRTLPA